MSDNQSLRKRFEKLKKFKKSKQFYAERLGVSVKEVEKLMGKSKIGQRKSSFFSDETTGKAEFTKSFPDEVKTKEELIEKANIDLTKWDIDKWVQNYWGNEENPHWQVKVWLSPKNISEEEKWVKVLDSYKSKYIPIQKSDLLLNDSFGRPCMAQISLLDFHLDKQTIDNVSLEERGEEWLSVINNLLYKCYRSYRIEEIVFIVGEDFFHSDTYNNTTTKGTPVDVNTSWFESYEKGFDLHVKAINKMKNMCERLKIILVQGNHDRTKSYYLAHALEVYFANDPNIQFDRSNSNLKHVKYGSTFIGYHHGNCKVDDLPIIFATSQNSSEDFGKSVYREIHVGDKHTHMEKEVRGSNVRIKRLPSLSGDDRWHNDELFINHIRAGVALVYDYSLGRVAEFEERIPNTLNNVNKQNNSKQNKKHS